MRFTDPHMPCDSTVAAVLLPPPLDIDSDVSWADPMDLQPFGELNVVSYTKKHVLGSIVTLVGSPEHVIPSYTAIVALPVRVATHGYAMTPTFALTAVHLLIRSFIFTACVPLPLSAEHAPVLLYTAKARECRTRVKWLQATDGGEMRRTITFFSHALTCKTD